MDASFYEMDDLWGPKASTFLLMRGSFQFLSLSLPHSLSLSLSLSLTHSLSLEWAAQQRHPFLYLLFWAFDIFLHFSRRKENLWRTRAANFFQIDDSQKMFFFTNLKFQIKLQKELLSYQLISFNCSRLQKDLKMITLFKIPYDKDTYFKRKSYIHCT